MAARVRRQISGVKLFPLRANWSFSSSFLPSPKWRKTVKVIACQRAAAFKNYSQTIWFGGSGVARWKIQFQSCRICRHFEECWRELRYWLKLYSRVNFVRFPPFFQFFVTSNMPCFCLFFHSKLFSAQDFIRNKSQEGYIWLPKMHRNFAYRVRQVVAL